MRHKYLIALTLLAATTQHIPECSCQEVPTPVQEPRSDSSSPEQQDQPTSLSTNAHEWVGYKDDHLGYELLFPSKPEVSTDLSDAKREDFGLNLFPQTLTCRTRGQMLFVSVISFGSHNTLNFDAMLNAKLPKLRNKFHEAVIDPVMKVSKEKMTRKDSTLKTTRKDSTLKRDNRSIHRSLITLHGTNPMTLEFHSFIVKLSHGQSAIVSMAAMTLKVGPKTVENSERFLRGFSTHVADRENKDNTLRLNDRVHKNMPVGITSWTATPIKESGNLEITSTLKNNTTKGIKLIDGRIHFFDLLGETIAVVKISRDIYIGPKKTADDKRTSSSRSAFSSYVPGRLLKLKSSDVAVSVQIDKLVFEDNTVLDLTD